MTLAMPDEPGVTGLDKHIEIQMGRRAPFTQVGDWVLLSGVSDRAVALYCRLAMHINIQRGDTQVWPAVEALAEFAGLGKPDSITPYMDELVVIGAITVQQSRYANGLRTRNRYVVHQAPPQDYTGIISVADCYRLRREHPTEYATWCWERRQWIAVQAKALAGRRKAEDAQRKAEKAGTAALRPVVTRTPLERGTARPGKIGQPGAFPVPRSSGVRAPLQRGLAPRHGGVEQDVVEQDEFPLSPPVGPGSPGVATGNGEREVNAAPIEKLTPAQTALRASGVKADEESAFMAWATVKQQVRGPGFWVTAASNGTIPSLVAAWRADCGPAVTTVKPWLVGVPDWCGKCGGGGTAAKSNVKFRTLTGGVGGEPCPDCHPSRARAA